LKRYFPFGVTRLGEITKLDISQKLARLKDAPSQQNHAAIYVKVFFNWAIAEGYLETNPLQHYKQAKKTRRKRILTDDELQAVWNAAGEIGGMFGVIVQLIILSGQRRDEIAALLRATIAPAADDVKAKVASTRDSGRSRFAPTSWSFTGARYS
jgi:integrase